MQGMIDINSISRWITRTLIIICNYRQHPKRNLYFARLKQTNKTFNKVFEEIIFSVKYFWHQDRIDYHT